MLLLVAIVWGINPPIIKIGLQFIPPQPYNVARMIVASFVAVFALVISGTHRRPTRADLWRLLKLSAFGFFVFQIFFTEGIQRTTSGNASIILCLMPASVLLLNKIFGLETISRTVVLGIVCSILGVMLIVIGSSGTVSLNYSNLLGALFVLLSQVGYAYYTVFSKPLQERYSTYQVTAYLMVFTTLLLVGTTLRESVDFNWSTVPLLAWQSILFSGILALCVCNFLWIWGAGKIGTSRASIFNNVSPIFAVLTGYILLGETFGLVQVLGTVFVFSGITITRQRAVQS